MIILSHGYKKPQTGDFGDVWFPALEDNIDLSNSHNHDGVSGEKINSISLTANILTITSGSFVDQGNGYWRALVTVPSSGLVDNFAITIKDPTTKDPVFLKMEKFSSTQFYVFTNTVQDFEAYFGI